MIPIAFPPLPGGGDFRLPEADKTARAVKSSNLQSLEQAKESREDKKIHEAALQFEGILVRQLLQPLEQSLTKGMGGGSGASPMVGGMIVNSLGEAITDGGGLGLAAVIEESLRESVVEKVSATTDNDSRPVLPGGRETD